MKSSFLKCVSALVAILPASAQVLAGVKSDDERDANQAHGLLASGTSMNINDGAVYAHLRAALPESAEINQVLLKDAVFGLNEDGSLEVIGTKSEIKKLIQENRKLKREVHNASRVAPTTY